MKIQFPVVIACMTVSALAVNCTTGAVVFAVRGSDPSHMTLDTDPAYDVLAPGMNATATAVIKRAGSGYISAVPYPAVNSAPGLYLQSVAIGINATQKAVSQYITSCPFGKIYLLGFSQGAQVVSSALAGTTDFAPLKYGERIHGIVLWADPTFINKIEPLDAGNATANGLNGTVPGGSARYPFLNQKYGNRMRVFCQSGDQFCDSAFNTTTATAHAIHLAEPQTYQAAATAFLLGLL